MGGEQAFSAGGAVFQRRGALAPGAARPAGAGGQAMGPHSRRQSERNRPACNNKGGQLNRRAWLHEDCLSRRCAHA